MKSDYNGNGRRHTTSAPGVPAPENADVTHEMSDVDIRGILTFVVGLTVMTVVVFLLMWLMFRVLNAQEETRDTEAARSPMAMSAKERVPPEPRLQSAPGFAEALERETGEKPMFGGESGFRDPLWEIDILRQHWQYTLANGDKDPNGTLVILPIKKAKQALLKQGLPARSAPEPGGDFSFALQMPTAASSGRLSEKRK